VEIAARIFASAGNAGFAVADDAGVRGDPAFFRERPQSQDHAGGIAAGIGDQARLGNLIRIDFWNAVGGFAEPICVRRGQFVPGRECVRGAEAKGAAQIHDAEACIKQGRRDFRRNFMRRSEKRSTRAAGNDGLHGERSKWSFAPTAELRKEFRETFRAVGFAYVEDRRRKLGVAQKNARQLKAGVTGHTYDGDAARISHFTRSSIFLRRERQVFLFGVMMRTVSSPAMVPAISGNLAPSTAAASG
jgi:hypothetical protein